MLMQPKLAGYPADDNVYETAPRARIFRRDAANVTCLADMKRLLRYNRFQTDPLSGGNPAAAIAARYDLDPVPTPSPDASSSAAHARRLSSTMPQLVPNKHGNWTRHAFGAVDAKAVDGRAFR